MFDAVSVLPGRIRFKSEKVYGNKKLARILSIYLDGFDGVCDCHINIFTGSILVQYDIDKTNQTQLAKNIESAIASEDHYPIGDLRHLEFYYETIDKRDHVKRLFLSFSALYLFLKFKHASFGKFSLSRSLGVLEVASAVTIIGGYPLLKQYYKRFSKTLPTDADLLLKLTATSFTILRESSKGVFVLVLKYLGDYIKYSAEVECLKTLNSTMGKTAGMAWMILPNNEEVLVSVDSLNPGDIIAIHKGELSAINGEIISGKAVMNSLFHTGQPVVTQVGYGNHVQEGATVVFGELRVRVESIPKSFAKNDMPLDQLRIYQQVGAYQNKITKIALGAAGLNYILTGNMLNALSMLLVLTPSSTATALNQGMKNYIASLKNRQIYLRNPNTFEKIMETNCIMFDKTGTLTYGNMKIKSIESFNQNYSRSDLLRISAACEANHYHPISITLQDYVDGHCDISKVQSSVLIPSQGIEAIYDHQQLLIGNLQLFEQQQVDLIKGIDQYKAYEADFYFPLFIAINHELVGLITMEDALRENAQQLIAKLKYSGIKDINLLTGDTYEKGINTAQKLGINNVYSECTYEDKVSVITNAIKFRTVMMVGDGINDIGAMKASHVSISFAHSACDPIKLHSDCVIFEEHIEGLAELISISQKAHRMMQQTLTLSRLYHILFGTLAFFQYFDAFTAKSINTINSLLVLVLNERIRWITPDKTFELQLRDQQRLQEKF